MLTSREDLGRYWKELFDTIREALLVTSPSGLIIAVNRAAEEITGYKAAELVGQPCTILECTGCTIFGRGAGADWCELFNVGAVDSKRCLITAKDGKPIHVMKRANTFSDENGQIIGAVEALTDIRSMVRQEEEIDRLRRSLAQEDGFHGLVGRSEAMGRVFSLIEDAARSESAVMITGESGTGKELVAQAIHKLSVRAAKPFVKVDCVALNPNLLESELFGHVKGAFTGAEKTRLGRFQMAQGGAVFLDEIGDVPLPTQVKLLRVLEDKVVEQVGDSKPIEVDVRVVSATNRNLSELMKSGQFREDLFYRINVIPIRIPPLRERRDDIPLLARTFAQRQAIKTGRPIDGFTPEALALMFDYNWPGNVRELKNAVDYAFVVCREGLIAPGDLPDVIRQAGKAYCPSPSPTGPDSPATGTAMEPAERQILIEALRQAGGNQSQAAKILGVSRMTVWKRMKKHDVTIGRDVS